MSFYKKFNQEKEQETKRKNETAIKFNSNSKKYQTKPDDFWLWVYCCKSHSMNIIYEKSKLFLQVLVPGPNGQPINAISPSPNPPVVTSLTSRTNTMSVWLLSDNSGQASGFEFKLRELWFKINHLMLNFGNKIKLSTLHTKACLSVPLPLYQRLKWLSIDIWKKIWTKICWLSISVCHIVSWNFTETLQSISISKYPSC